MARFSSVAYEDPPKANDDNAGGMAGVEHFVDNYGVSIARPIYQCNNNSQMVEHDLEEGGPDKNNATWNTAHCDELAPRPLTLMLSRCNAPGMLKGEEMPFGNARF